MNLNLDLDFDVWLKYVFDRSAFILLFAALFGFASMKTQLYRNKDTNNRLNSANIMNEEIGNPNVGNSKNDLHTGLLTDRL